MNDWIWYNWTEHFNIIIESKKCNDLIKLTFDSMLLLIKLQRFKHYENYKSKYTILRNINMVIAFQPSFKKIRFLSNLERMFYWHYSTFS